MTTPEVWTDALRALLAPFAPAALHLYPGPTCACTPDLRIVFVNRAWNEFARANAARANDPPIGMGQNLLDVTPAVLRPFYRQLFERARTSAEPVEWEYECSSATTTREYRMRVMKCKSGATVVSHSLVRSADATPDSRSAAEALYRDENGLIHQCAHCRRVRRAGQTTQWDWVSAFVEAMPLRTSHALCPICDAYYYPP